MCTTAARRSSTGRWFSRWIGLPAIASAGVLLAASTLILRRTWRPAVLIEIAVVVYLSLVVLQFQRRPRRAAILWTVVLLAFYGVCWARWSILQDSFTIYDLRSLGELVFVLPPAWCLACGAAALVIGIAFVGNLRWPGTWEASVMLLPLLAYTLAILSAPDAVESTLQFVRPDMTWNRNHEIWRNGPLFTVARQFVRAIIVRRMLAQSVDTSAVGAIRPEVLAQLPPPRRNVHIIHLESFVDPLNFRALHFPVDPLDHRFRQWLQEGHSLALAPSYGGESARAEFEVLCGVPSYDLVGVEFTALTGASMRCLPALLRQYGYTTLASVPSPATFFNIARVYPAVGFTERYFESAFELSDLDGWLLSDAAFFRQMLPRIEGARRRGTPVLDHLVTFAGHVPMALNPVLRPPVFSGDSWAAKVANATHYNSAAVADFIETIEARDPDAIIVAYGDHLPPLGVFGEGFRDGGYRLAASGPAFWEGNGTDALDARATPLIVRFAGQTLPLGIVPDYVLPEVILNLLTDGAYCRVTTCLRSSPVIYRPIGLHALFTTPESFPRPLCANAAAREDGRCIAGTRVHHTLVSAYTRLLHDGLAPVGHPVAAS